MPQVDGFEMARRLREGGSTTPVLMLTAKDEVENRVKGLDTGADDYLVKPFALEVACPSTGLARRKTGDDSSNHRLTFEDLVMDTDAREVIRAGKDWSSPPRNLRLRTCLCKIRSGCCPAI